MDVIDSALTLDGGMLVLGQPDAKLLHALSTVSRHLHAVMEMQPGVTPGISRESCVWASMSVGLFLHRAGIPAKPTACELEIAGPDPQEPRYGRRSMTFARNDQWSVITRGDRWGGHLVCLTDTYLIDTTLYRVADRRWFAGFPGMIAVPYRGDAGTRTVLPGPYGQIDVEWRFDRRNTSWRQGGDATDRKHVPVAEQLRTLHVTA